MKTKFIPIEYDYFDFQGRNYALIIGRDEKGKRICAIDSCPSYIWAILKEGVSQEKIKKLIEKISKIELESKGRNTKVEKVELHSKNFLGKQVKALKVFATNYKDLHEVADQLDMPEIEKRRGYDLGFVTHYIIEKNILPLEWYEIEGEVLNNSLEFGSIDSSLETDFCINLKSAKKLEKPLEFKPKALAFDIETEEFQIGGGEILMVSLASDKFKKVITWKKEVKDKQDFVEYVKDEAELLEKFAEYVKKISPDFLVGYFSDGFDMPYLKARAEKNKVKLNIGLDDSQPKISRGIMTTCRTFGMVHIDLLKFIQTAYAQYLQSETLSLNEVAQEFLGDKKKDFKIRHSEKLDNQDWKDFFEYNLHDSILTYQLFEKMWPDMAEFTKVTKEPVVEISRAGLSKFVESYILHNLDKFNEIPEKRPTYDEIGTRRARQPSEGAFVYEPKPGIYENVVMFDFTSMHTSIIVSFNLSKATLLDKKEKDCYESPELEFQGYKKKFYFSKKPGFFPLLVKEIFEKRKHFKSEYKKNPSQITKARSNAFKLLSASVHGYVAFFGARYFSAEASNSILAFVRSINKEAIEKTKSAGFNVIYADTDSVAFARGKSSKENVLKFLNKLNTELPGIMELELEDFYKRGIWVTRRSGDIGAKKKYAMIGEDGKLKIRGFETVRRDWCKLARVVQNNVLRMILDDGNEKRAVEYIKETIKKIKERKIPKEDIAIRTKLKKPISEYKAISPHVIAAKKMEEQKIPIDDGALIEFFIAETREKKKLVREKVKLMHEKGEYDINYYLHHQILPAVENILQVFNINTTELLEGRKQTKLGDF